MSTFIKKFAGNDDGATAIEYGLIAAIVALGIIASLGTLKNALNNAYSAAGNGMTTAIN